MKILIKIIKNIFFFLIVLKEFISKEEVVMAKTKNFEGKDHRNTRIEVLETKIKVDSKNYENEKEKIIIEKDRDINSLEAKNECLLSELDKKTEKIRQLDVSNRKKDSQLQKNQYYMEELKKKYEVLKKRADNLETEISSLEEKRSQLAEIVQSNEENEVSMETQIHSLKRELDLVRAEKLEQEKIIAQMQSDAKNLDQKWKAQMERQEEIERLRDEKWEERMKIRDEKAEEKEKENDLKWEDRIKRQEEKAKEKEKENDQKWEIRMKLRDEVWERRMTRQGEDVKDERNERIKIYEKMERVLGEVSRSTKEFQNNTETVVLSHQNDDKISVSGSKNIQFRNGNHFYVRQSSRRQGGNISRGGKIQTPMQLTLPTDLRSSQNRRGNYFGSKLPSYKK